MTEANLKTTLLFVNELADDLGFASPLLAMARAVTNLARQQDRNLRVVFALRDAIHSGAQVADCGYQVIPAPIVPNAYKTGARGARYADVLVTNGFAHPKELALAVNAWDRIFALVEPDVIVADNSPVACLAARGRVPVFVTGNGFSVPPDDGPVFPPLGAEGGTDFSQDLLCQTVNEVLAERGAGPVGQLPGLLSGDARAVCSLPVLDPYADLRGEPGPGPCDPVEPSRPPAAPLLFMNVSSFHPNLGEIVRALDHGGMSTACYAHGPSGIGSTFLKRRGALLHDARPSLHDALETASVILSGDFGLSQAAFMAGRPQIVLTSNIEMSITGDKLQELGCAICVRGVSAGEVAAAIREISLNPDYLERAQEQAQVLMDDRPRGEGMAGAAQTCLDLAARSDAG